MNELVEQALPVIKETIEEPIVVIDPLDVVGKSASQMTEWLKAVGGGGMANGIINAANTGYKIGYRQCELDLKNALQDKLPEIRDKAWLDGFTKASNIKFKKGFIQGSICTIVVGGVSYGCYQLYKRHKYKKHSKKITS